MCARFLHTIRCCIGLGKSVVDDIGRRMDYLGHCQCENAAIAADCSTAAAPPLARIYVLLPCNVHWKLSRGFVDVIVHLQPL